MPGLPFFFLPLNEVAQRGAQHHEPSNSNRTIKIVLKVKTNKKRTIKIKSRRHKMKLHKPLDELYIYRQAYLTAETRN